MYKIRLGLLISLVCLPSLCLGDLVPFIRAQQTGSEFDAVFEWGDANNKFRLTARGQLSSKSDTTKPGLKLSIGKRSWIEHLFVLDYNKDLLLAFETNDGDEGNGHICRINSTMDSIAWCQSVAGFNLFAATGKDTLYLGAIGFVGRLSPETGKLIWQHADLYNKDNTFNIVCPASETDATISFHATTGIKGEANKQITLDRHSGKVIQIAVITDKTVCQ
ncbi:MAG TPA: hypothetical protein VFY78_09195 [Gammaproteobacteria bacterium]|nr:hypothetical protein [Gammaproteobacteria bacterium]